MIFHNGLTTEESFRLELRAAEIAQLGAEIAELSQRDNSGFLSQKQIGALCNSGLLTDAQMHAMINA